jgi:hypothetical protein
VIERLDPQALAGDAEAVERIAQGRSIEPGSALDVLLLIWHETIS